MAVKMKTPGNLALAIMLISGMGLAFPAGDAQAETEFRGKKAGDFHWNIRAIAVIPDEDSSVAAPVGGDVEIGGQVAPELDLAYFWTDNWATELVLTTTPHNASLRNSALGPRTALGEFMLLPPTLLMQYHFMPEKRFSPYLGAGVNYNIIYDEEAAGNGINDVDYDDTIGYALQAGMDYQLGNGWSFNLDIKKYFIEVDARVNNAVDATVDVDPWLIGIGVGYRFTM